MAGRWIPSSAAQAGLGILEVQFVFNPTAGRLDKDGALLVTTHDLVKRCIFLGRSDHSCCNDGRVRVRSDRVPNPRRLLLQAEHAI